MSGIKDNYQIYLQELVTRYPKLQSVQEEIADAYLTMRDSYLAGGKLLIAGNGGSAADAEHIVGELMKSFDLKRQIDKKFSECLLEIDEQRGRMLAENLQKTLPAIALTSHVALFTAYINDAEPSCVFAQQIYGYGEKGDVFLAISTSGNSENILHAAVTAKAIGMKVVGLTGETGERLAEYADVLVKAPERVTHYIQELHLPVYHCWCLMLEEYFYGREMVSRRINE